MKTVWKMSVTQNTPSTTNTRVNRKQQSLICLYVYVYAYIYILHCPQFTVAHSLEVSIKEFRFLPEQLVWYKYCWHRWILVLTFDRTNQLCQRNASLRFALRICKGKTVCNLSSLSLAGLFVHLLVRGCPHLCWESCQSVMARDSPPERMRAIWLLSFSLSRARSLPLSVFLSYSLYLQRDWSNAQNDQVLC